MKSTHQHFFPVYWFSWEKQFSSQTPGNTRRVNRFRNDHFGWSILLTVSFAPTQYFFNQTCWFTVRRWFSGLNGRCFYRVTRVLRSSNRIISVTNCVSALFAFHPCFLALNSPVRSVHIDAFTPLHSPFYAPHSEANNRAAFRTQPSFANRWRPDIQFLSLSPPTPTHPLHLLTWIINAGQAINILNVAAHRLLLFPLSDHTVNWTGWQIVK